MQRVKHDYQLNLIKGAISLLPIEVLPYLETVDFVFDYSPIYLGFNPPSQLNSHDSRSYLDTCHYVWSWNAPDKKQNIFLYSKCLYEYGDPFDVIWHEIAHAIHEQLGIINYGWIPLWYYEEWYVECFACSFTRWLYPDRNTDSWYFNQESQRQYDKRPIEFFNRLFNKVRI